MLDTDVKWLWQIKQTLCLRAPSAYWANLLWKIQGAQEAGREPGPQQPRSAVPGCSARCWAPPSAQAGSSEHLPGLQVDCSGGFPWNPTPQPADGGKLRAPAEWPGEDCAPRVGVTPTRGGGGWRRGTAGRGSTGKQNPLEGRPWGCREQAAQGVGSVGNPRRTRPPPPPYQSPARAGSPSIKLIPSEA